MTALKGFSPLVRKKIRDRASVDGFPVCEIQVACDGAPVDELHHRRCRGMGSTRRPETNQPANGAACCYRCHLFAESNRQTALMYGWLVPQGKTPSEVPMYRRHEWVLLDDLGDYQQIPEPKNGRVA